MGWKTQRENQAKHEGLKIFWRPGRPYAVLLPSFVVCGVPLRSLALTNAGLSDTAIESTLKMIGL